MRLKLYVLSLCEGKIGMHRLFKLPQCGKLSYKIAQRLVIIRRSSPFSCVELRQTHSREQLKSVDELDAFTQ